MLQRKHLGACHNSVGFLIVAKLRVKQWTHSTTILRQVAAFPLILSESLHFSITVIVLYFCISVHFVLSFRSTLGRCVLKKLFENVLGWTN